MECSPDLISFDRFLREDHQSALHPSYPHIKDDLKNAITAGYDNIRPKILTSAKNCLMKRNDMCLNAKCAHFHHL